MASLSSLTVTVQVDTHGGLEDGRIGVVRRTIALWFISVAQWLLKTCINITFVK